MLWKKKEKQNLEIKCKCLTTEVIASVQRSFTV